MVTEFTMQRLAFIRYTYLLGKGQSKEREPNNLISILIFHDSIELFFELVSDFLDVSTKSNQQFLDYWEQINKKIAPNQLYGKESIIRLNDARKSLKHSGIFVDQSQIKEFELNVKSFFEINTPIIFNIDFNEISIIDLITNENVRDYLKSAKSSEKENNYHKAMEHITQAFYQLFEDYEKQKNEFLENKALFHLPSSLDWLETSEYKFEDEKSRTFFNNLVGSIEQLEVLITIIGLGLDYRKYLKFVAFTPKVVGHSPDMKQHVLIEPVVDNKIHEENFTFCFDFVIEAALAMQKIKLN